MITNTLEHFKMTFPNLYLGFQWIYQNLHEPSQILPKSDCLPNIPVCTNGSLIFSVMDLKSWSYLFPPLPLILRSMTIPAWKSYEFYLNYSDVFMSFPLHYHLPDLGFTVSHPHYYNSFQMIIHFNNVFCFNLAYIC